MSLKIFYSIVLVNAVIALICAYSYIGMPYILDAFLRKWYHTIVWNGIENGVLNSMQGLDVLKFALELQAEEYKNINRAPEVKLLYEDLLKYLYHHPHQKGFEAAAVALESDDTFLREAAANVVGWWINLGKDGGETLMLQVALISKLADALEHQRTGRAAAFSFEQMARKFPDQTVIVRNSRDQWLVYILIKRIHEVVLRGPDMALVFLKVVAVLMEMGVFSVHKDIGIFSGAISPDVLFSTLRSDLLQIACDTTAEKRTLVIAAYCLFKLDSKNLKSEELCNIKDALINQPDVYLKDVYLMAVLEFLNHNRILITENEILRQRPQDTGEINSAPERQITCGLPRRCMIVLGFGSALLIFILSFYCIFGKHVTL